MLFQRTNPVHFSLLLIGLTFFALNPKLKTMLAPHLIPFADGAIGSGEFLPTLAPFPDAGVSAYLNDSLECTGGTNIIVEVTNFGDTLIDDLTVSWTINSILQTPVSYTTDLDTLGSGQETAQILLGSHSFTVGVVDTIVAWTDLNGGLMDGDPANDTLTLLASGGMEGTFTIGGASPDYLTITDAVNALTSSGVCGDVTFDIRSGTYSEQVLIPEIAGADSLRQITFRSATGDSTDVNLTYSSVDFNNIHTLKLDGADWINFEAMTISATNTSYCRVVEIRNGANHNRFSNCVVQGPFNTNGYACFRSYNDARNEFLTIRNCEILGNGYGIYLNGVNDGIYDRGVEISNNRLTDNYYQGMYLVYHSGIRVLNNVVSRNAGNANYNGIYILRSYESPELGGNQILVQEGRWGIYADLIYGSVEKPALLANNYIYLDGNANSANGIYAYRGNYHDYVHNTIHLTGTGSSNFAFFALSGSNKRVLNNLFVHSGGGLAYYRSSGVNVSDYNALYSNGPVLGFWNGEHSDLASWISASQQDSNSIVVNPLFYAPGSFAVAETDLNGAGTPFPMVTTDIQGEARDLVAPDIGCDEFAPAGVDAGILAVASPAKPFANGQRDVKVILKNYGSNPLTSVDISWELNGAQQTDFAWTGNLAANDTISVAISTSTVFQVGQPYEIKSWSTLPNGQTDPVAANDTAAVGPIYTALNGTYTIGGSNPDFATFNEANNLLINGGILGPVIFEVRNGTYTEQISIPEIFGADSLNTITFQSESGDSSQVILNFDAVSSIENYVVELDGADWIVFRGITIEALDNNYCNVFDFRNQANHNQVLNSRIVGPLGTSGFSVYLRSTNKNQDNLISNSVLVGNGYGVYAPGNSSHGTYTAGLEIVENEFLDQRYYGIYIAYHDDPQVIGNRIINDDYSGYRPVELVFCYNGAIINRNFIRSVGGIYGLYMNRVYGTVTEAVSVANNFVFIVGDNGSNIYGLYSFSGNYHDYLYNTVHVTSPVAQSRAFNSTGGGHRLYNNNFVNTGGGYAVYASSTLSGSDHNNFYTTGPILGYRNGDRAELADWIAYNQQDSMSLSVDPKFIVPDSFAISQVDLNGAAEPISGLDSDIEGEPRDGTNPDIGCDEFSPAAVDAGIVSILGPMVPFPAGNNQVEVIIKNYGSDPITNVDIEWEVNQSTQPPFNWTGNLLSGAEDTLTIGNFTFNINTGYVLEAWTSNPNTIADAVLSNDTIVNPQVYAALAGVYTIGGTTPDFSNFTEAAANLNNGGVLGPVTFNVRDGIYNEQINLSEFAGVSSADTVLFQSESADSTAVVLTFDANSTDNYTLLMDGADHVTIKGITIEGTDPSYSTVVRMTNGANYNNFYHNLIRGVPVGNGEYGIRIFTGVNEYNTFIGNRFEYNQYGLYIEGNYNDANYVSGIVVDGNQFINQYSWALYNGSLSNPVIRNNYFTNDATSSTSYLGCYLTNTYHGMEISGNIMDLRTGNMGIYMVGTYGLVNSPVLAANNFIHIGGQTSTAYGIFDNSGSFHRFYHNSISITNTVANSYAMYLISGSDVEVKNNIMYNSGGGYAYYRTSSSGLNSDHNNLYTTGPNLAYLNGDHADLAALVTASEEDSMSVSLNPLFVNDTTDLHVTNVLLDKTGTPVAEVPLDIDGANRDPVSPDIGADEFTTDPNDAGVSRLNYPVQPFPGSNLVVNVDLFNNGLDTLESATINWAVNGEVQSPFTWMGQIPSGEKIDSVDIGSFAFQIDTAYTISAWTSAPNGGTDGNLENDSITVNDLYASLSGVYTIGGTNPDFDNFNEAVMALERGGVVAPVTFNVRSGVYNEQVSIHEIPFADSTKTITFQSESGDTADVVLAYSNDGSLNYTLQFNGADWVTFRQMTIEALNPSYVTAIEFQGGSNHNTLANNLIKGQGVNSTSSALRIIYAVSFAVNEYNNIIDNDIKGGSYGLYYLGNYNNNNYTRGLTVRGNRFSDQYRYAIYTDDQAESEISNNRIIGNKYGGFTGIEVHDGWRDLTVTGNQVWVTLGGTGIEIDRYLENGSGNFALIANNYVRVSGSNTGYGLRTINGGYQKIYHNTVRMDGTASITRCYFNQNGASNIVLNNIFYNEAGGYAFYYDDGTTAFANSDYNDLYTTGDDVGYWGTPVADLDDWRSITGFDANSFSLDPRFSFPDSFLIEEIDLNDAAFPVPEVTTDIEGELRDQNNPDLGADEFAPVVPNDAGIAEAVFPNREIPFGSGLQPVSVTIKNNGSDTITSATIDWIIDDIIQPPVAWTGQLFPGERDTVSLGNFDFDFKTPHDIIAYTSLPNGMPDSTNYNDTLVVRDLYAALDGTYTIGGVLPDFPTFGDAVEILNQGGVLGQVTFNVRNGFFNERVTINEVNGASAQNNIIFQSESGDSNLVKLTYNSNFDSRYTIHLDGADHVTFRGMTIESESNSYGEVIYLENRADSNAFENNVIVVSGGPLDPVLSSSASTQENGTRILNNLLRNGSYGISLSGQGASSLETGTQIRGNTFENQQYNSIYLVYQEAPRVSYNDFLSNIYDNNNHSVFLYLCDGALRVTHNQFALTTRGGIQLQSCDGTNAAYGLIANNFVQIGRNMNEPGIHLYDCDFQKVYNNSVHITNSSASSSALAVNYGSDVIVLNNILAHSGGGYAIYFNQTANVSNSDYNDLYTSGPSLGYRAGTQAADLNTWRSISGEDGNSVSADPLFFAPDNLHVLQVALDSAAVPLPEITDDIDGELRNGTHPDIGADEFDFLTDDLGIVAVLEPKPNCELTNNEQVKVVVQNYGGLPQSGFDVVLMLNGSAPVTENVGALSIAPGDTAHYLFNATFDLSEYQDHEVISYTLLSGDLKAEDDSLTTTITNFQTPVSPVNMLPATGSTDLDKPVSFSWLPSAGATRYDVYIWPVGTPTHPPVPVAADLSQISYVDSGSNLDFGQSYNWQVVAKNDFCETESVVQTFTLRELADLEVSNIQVPVSAFSGQSFQVDWQVDNQGSGSTGSQQWYDAVYLSPGPTLSGSETFLGVVNNLTSLGPGQSYIQSATYNLPQGVVGNYYIIVKTDHYNYLSESDENDNIGNTPIQINLTPPPDLQVTSIIAPGNAFSDQTISVTWSVENIGTGPTTISAWHDRIYLSDSPVFNPNTATVLKTPYHNGGSILQPDSTYTETTTVDLPEGIFGDYYIHVTTDHYNTVFEFAFEDNNFATSSVMNVILTPPPDLIVSNNTVPDSASTGESIVIQWSILNQGASLVTDNWRDIVYLSQGQTLNGSETLLANPFNTQDLDAGQGYSRQTSVLLPSNLAGTYYVVFAADGNNQVYEFTNENNNVTASSPIVISPPDLVLDSVGVASGGLSGQSLNVAWAVRNDGRGRVINESVTDRIFLSPQLAYDPGLVTELGEVTYTLNLEPGQVSGRQLEVNLPNGIFGNYFILVNTDANEQIFEDANEGNNTGYDDIMIALSPSADLLVDSIGILPDSVTAGTNIPLQFSVSNAGLAPAEGSTWVDKLFISVDSIWDPDKVVFLSEIERLQSLDPMDSYEVSTEMTFPMLSLMVAGLDSFSHVYLYIQTDGDDEIFEYDTANSNNIFRSQAIHVTCPPPVDLLPTWASSIPDTAFSGAELTVQWTVLNQGSTTAFWDYDLWYDGFYLSTDTIWDYYDILIEDFTETGPLGENASYTDEQSFNLPAGISGDYYLLLVADNQAYNNDGDPSNNTIVVPVNGMQGRIHIQQSPTPDLQLNSFSSPLTGTAGQPIEVIWNVANSGNGTPQSEWTDKLYLSTDFTIDGSDIILASRSQNRSLTPGTNFTDTLEATLPIDQEGNFILLFKTDANGEIFELNGENNNELFAYVSIDRPDPSDLVITSIAAPAMAMVNEEMDVDWVVRNQGQFPANGRQRDIIYLSTDSLLDPLDEIIGVKELNSNLGPQSEESRSLTMTPTPGVALGDYFLLVQTDALNNIVELVDTNNTAIAPQKVTVSVPELPLNTNIAKDLVDTKSLYYRIEIPGSLAGETLLISLTSDAPNSGNNEMYLTFGSMPNRANHDFSHDGIPAANQDLLVPALDSGTYYLQVYGVNTASAQQNIGLYAEIIPFQLRSVMNNRGGNTGSVTVRVEGARMEADMDLSLQKNGVDTIYASNLYYVNSTEVYASFNLAGATEDVYDLVARKMDNSMTSLPAAFTIEAGAVGNFSGGNSLGGNSGFTCNIKNIGVENLISSNVITPSAVRVGRVVPITIQFGNNSNIDIPCPTRFLISVRGAPLGYTPEELSEGKQELFLEFTEAGGPPNVLRPGATGTVTVYSFSSHPLRFYIQE